MSVTYTNHATDRDVPGRDKTGERLRNGIVMAVFLCAGIAGGVLLSLDFRERASGYQAHAAGYLEDDAAAPAAYAPAVNTVSSQAPAAAPLCQEYTKHVTIGGQSETIYGTACRQPDGTWDVVQ